MRPRVVRLNWGHWDPPWGSLDLFGVVGLIRARPVGRWIHSVSLGSFGCALGVVGFIRVRWVH